MAAGDTLRRLSPQDQWIFDASGNLAGVKSPNSSGADLRLDQPTMLVQWALVQAFRVTAPPTRNADGAVTSAPIAWPDGVTGTYTADTISTAFPGSTDAWRATYNATPVKTITQPAVTRDADGNVTTQPALTVA